MGCRKLSYYEPEGVLEVNPIFLDDALEKNAPSEKNRVSCYRYGFNGMEKDDEVKGSGNSYDFGARIHDPRLGRWLSVDPLQGKFPAFSPYNFTANNPILLIDPDGRDIIIHRSNGTSFTYKPGMEVPTDDDFAASIVKSLNDIHSLDQGSQVVSTLVNSSTKHNVRGANSWKGTNFSIGAEGSRDAEFENLVGKKDFKGAQDFLENTDQTDITISTGSFKGWQRADNVEMNSTIALGHELFHAYQFESGSFIGAYTGSVSGGVNLAEAWAVGFENYLRAGLFGGTEFGTTRASYSWGTIDSYMEEADWWDYIIGFDALEVEEFQEGGSAFGTWTDEMPSQAAEETKEKVGP